MIKIGKKFLIFTNWEFLFKKSLRFTWDMEDICLLGTIFVNADWMIKKRLKASVISNDVRKKANRGFYRLYIVHMKHSLRDKNLRYEI